LIRRPPSVINGEIITGDSSDEEQSTRVFEKLVDYPCNFQVKVIGLKQGHFTTDIIDIVARVCGVASDQIKFTLRPSRSEKYLSISVECPVQNADMLYEVYGELDKDPRVKFKF
jgi:putative lipoic acid-binding regulatory protein